MSARRTTFKIAKMDCAAEEQLVRMKLDGVRAVCSLRFDLRERTLEVVHTGEDADIHRLLDSLRLGAAIVVSEEAGEPPAGREPYRESRMLWQVLAINAAFFVVEIIAGFLANSMGLVADSLDMLADSIVYGLSLYAVRRSARHKKRVAAVSGYFQMALAVMGLMEVVRRFLGAEEMPSFQAMVGVSLFALAANVASLYLLQKSKSREVHIRATMICTSNDVIANCGVIFAGGLVYLTASNVPDLAVGIIIFGVVGRGAMRILRLSK